VANAKTISKDMLDDRDLRAILRDSGVSADDAGLLVRGQAERIEEYAPSKRTGRLERVRQ